MRRLIINADDLGLTPGVNRGIAECCRSGVVTSTTMMANGAAAADAIGMIRALSAEPQAGPAETASKVGVGCHVLLIDGVPVLPPAKVASLVNGAGFRSSLGSFARAALAGKIDSTEVETETAAQLAKLQSAGLRLSHFDTHKHVHLFPAVLKPVLRAARARGIRAVRNPFAPLKPLAFAHLARRPHLWKRYTEVRILRRWQDAFRREVEAMGMVTTDGTFGIVSTGALELDLFRAIVGCMPEGTWEFCCHPGHNDAALADVRTRLRESRDRERQVLTSAAARDVLRQHGIELISYWDLQ